MRSLLLLLLIGNACGEDGSAVYQKRCAGCHDNGVGRAPGLEAFKQMSPESVESALTNGMMMIQGVTMSNAEIRWVAEFVTAKPFGGDALPQQAFCSGAKTWPADPLAGPHWNGWGAGADNHRFQPAAMAGLTAGDVPKLKLAWAFGIPGSLRAY
ncbi:MAG TPA: cytochrome c, partial [Bryobacteraceae bacterium]|nr:cytochrome c [Bryobacteraceae bacterium]